MVRIHVHTVSNACRTTGAELRQMTFLTDSPRLFWVRGVESNFFDGKLYPLRKSSHLRRDGPKHLHLQRRLRDCSQRSEWRWPNSGLHDVGGRRITTTAGLCPAALYLLNRTGGIDTTFSPRRQERKTSENAGAHTATPTRHGANGVSKG